MKKVFITLSILLFLLDVHAQAFEWVFPFGGIATDRGRHITTDASGNLYVTGYFEDGADFDPGPASFNLFSLSPTFYDVFILKLTPSRSLIWAKSFGSLIDDEGHCLAVDNSGNVYTTGSFSLTADFDPGTGTTNHTVNGFRDVFVQKLDSSGNFLWARTFGGNSLDIGTSIAVDDSGSVYTMGIFNGNVDFDPGPDSTFLTSAGAADIFVQKLDASGNFLWAKSFGGSLADQSKSIVIDNSGDVYIAGSFRDTITFELGSGIPPLVSTGQLDCFIIKLNSNGTVLWARSFGGILDDEPQSITIDPSGHIYTTGYFYVTADFNAGIATANLTSSGFEDVFVQKLDPNGNFIWAKSFGGSLFDCGNSITTDTSGHLYITGYYQGSADFDPGLGAFNLNALGQRDVFVQKMDMAGNFLWATSFGGNANELAQSITVDASENVYTTGYYNGTVDWNSGTGTEISWPYFIGSTFYADIFVHKLSPCTTDSVIEVQTSCKSYTWPANSTTYTSSGTYLATVMNSVGCDSVITLDLTINTISDLTTTQNGETITANNPNATYQWLYCDSNYAAITGETSQAFTATSNGHYAVEITENGCVDTSACTLITTVGIEENSFGDSFEVYPNPTYGDFSIDLGTNYDKVEVSIMDITGRVISTKPFYQSQVLELLIEDPSGVYIVSVQSDKKKAIIRLVKY